MTCFPLTPEEKEGRKEGRSVTGCGGQMETHTECCWLLEAWIGLAGIRPAVVVALLVPSCPLLLWIERQCFFCFSLCVYWVIASLSLDLLSPPSRFSCCSPCCSCVESSQVSGEKTQRDFNIYNLQLPVDDQLGVSRQHGSFKTRCCYNSFITFYHIHYKSSMWLFYFALILLFLANV